MSFLCTDCCHFSYEVCLCVYSLGTQRDVGVGMFITSCYGHSLQRMYIYDS